MDEGQAPWLGPRSELRFEDTDVIGTDGRACERWGKTLAAGPVVGICVMQLGVNIAISAAARGMGDTLEVMRLTMLGQTPPFDASALLANGVFLAAVALAVLGLLSVPTTWVVGRRLRAAARDGGMYGTRLLRRVDAGLGGHASREERWREALRLETEGDGARPETTIRWLRSLETPPDGSLRPMLVDLRERFKLAHSLCQDAMLADRDGGLASMSLGGRNYEAAMLATLCLRAVDGLRDVLALI